MNSVDYAQRTLTWLIWWALIACFVLMVLAVFG